MRLDLAVAVVHVLIVWVAVRMLAGLAVSAGAQDLWVLAGATAGVVTLCTVLTSWLTRSWKVSGVRRTRRLLPAPFLGSLWTLSVVVTSDGTVPQVIVAAAAWLVGGAVGLLVVSLLAARYTRRRGALARAFGQGAHQPIRSVQGG